MTARLFKQLLLCISIILLSACSAEQSEYDKEQQYFFLESLKQVDNGGRQLQLAGLNQVAVTNALESLDQGLRLAFQVERKYLDKLDSGLGNNYQRYFIAGVENYRLGIEGADQAQQVRGLELLSGWGHYWSTHGAAIQAKLQPA